MTDFANLGFFYCQSGRLVVCDPSYGRKHLQHDQRTMNIATIVQNILPGRYAAAVRKDEEGEYNNDLVVWNIEYFGNRNFDSNWTQYSGDGGVFNNITICIDTEKAGIFDDFAYPQDMNSTGDPHDPTTFNGLCSYIATKTLIGAGIVGRSPTTGMGVVSSSGHGNGGYVLYAQRNPQLQIVALKLNFFDQSQDDYYDVDQSLFAKPNDTNQSPFAEYNANADHEFFMRDYKNIDEESDSDEDDEDEY